MQIEVDMSETKALTGVLVSTTISNGLLKRYSSHKTLQRMIAYWLRFKTNALDGKLSGPLSVEELDLTENYCENDTARVF